MIKNKNNSTETKQIIRCSKCFITLERLKKDGICENLLKIVDEGGREKNICRVCHEGW